MDHIEIMDIIKTGKSQGKRVEVLEELYWASLSEISLEDMETYLLPWILESESIEEYSLVQSLYQNPDAAHLEFFQDAIVRLYMKEPLKFIQAATEFPEIGLEIMYIFRNKAVFEDHEGEIERLKKETEDEELKSRIDEFFKNYEKLFKT